MSKVLWKWAQNVGSKERDKAKATSIAFVLLDSLFTLHSQIALVTKAHQFFKLQTFQTSKFTFHT